MPELLDLPSIAVDLPGRGSRPATGHPITYDDCVDAVITDADAAGMSRFILVGHSMGGLTLSRTAQRHPDRIAHLVYVAALVPPPGVSVAGLLGVDVGAGAGPADLLPTPDLDVARALFAGDMTDEQWAVASQSVGPEAVGLFRDTLSGHGHGIATTYIELTRDQPVPKALVDAMIVHLGSDVRRMEIDAAHNVMLSRPEALAEIINEAVLSTRLAAMVGQPLGSSGTSIAPDPVNQPMIRHWAAAFGDDNPLYVDPVAAAATPFGEIKAPPLMLQTWTMSTPELIGIAERGGAPVASNEDGPLTVLDRAGYVGTLATNSDYEIDRYLGLGEIISASTVLETVSDPKNTRMGQGRFVTWLTTYCDAKGVAVGRQRFRVLKFKPSGAAR